jgi:chitooligosaccharide deacetylase
VPALELTFDDGPDPTWTPTVLAALRDEGLVATFFSVCRRAALPPGRIEAVINAGRQIQLHRQEHLPHRLGPQRAGRPDRPRPVGAGGVRRPSEALATALERRAPWTAIMVDLNALDLGSWTADPRDSRGPRLRDGRIAGRPAWLGRRVLLCNGLGSDSQRLGCAQTVELVRRLGPVLRARDLAPTKSHPTGRLRTPGHP